MTPILPTLRAPTDWGDVAARLVWTSKGAPCLVFSPKLEAKLKLKEGMHIAVYKGGGRDLGLRLCPATDPAGIPVKYRDKRLCIRTSGFVEALKLKRLKATTYKEGAIPSQYNGLQLSVYLLPLVSDL